MSDWFSTDSPASSPDLEGAPQEAASIDPPLREGLPPTFRMRHDRHYVDELDARSPSVLVRMLPTDAIQVDAPVRLDPGAPLVESVRRVGVLQPVLVRLAEAGYQLIAGTHRVAAARAVGLAEMPCRVYTVDDHQADALAKADDLKGAEPVVNRPEGGSGGPGLRGPEEAPLTPMLGELADSLRAASSCWDICADAGDRPYAPVVREVTRVELQRATWFVHGLQVLSGPPPLDPVPVNVGRLLERTFALTRAERRLADVTLSADIGTRAIVTHGDEAMLLMAFGALMGVFVALVRSRAAGVIRCLATATSGLAHVEMSQTDLAVSETLVSRFSDLTLQDRPGGHTAAVNAAAANRVVGLHGGRLTAESLHPKGLKVAISLPLHPGD